MKLLKSTILAYIAAFSFNAVAVDGFQNFKFGMTLDEVKKVYKCDWKKYRQSDYRFECKNFKFLGETTRLLTEFSSEKKLVQTQILIPENKLSTVIENLPKKYKVSKEYSEKVEDGNRVARVQLDDDTIMIQITYKGKDDYDYTPILIYRDKDHLERKRAEEKQQIQNEL